MDGADRYFDVLALVCLFLALFLTVAFAVRLGRAIWEALESSTSKRSRWRRLQHIALPMSLAEHLLVIAALVGLYGAYSTVKASNRMSALQYISDNANYVGDIEQATPEVLCIYDWSGPFKDADLDGCGPDVFSSDGRLSSNFDEIQLYIEESLLFFAESTRIERRYQTRFYGGLPYWRSDFEADPTGAIAYYIVGRELEQAETLDNISPHSVACLEHMTDLRFNNLCKKYEAFVDRIDVRISPEFDGQSCSQLDDLSNVRGSANSEQQCRATWWVQNFAGGDDPNLSRRANR